MMYNISCCMIVEEFRFGGLFVGGSCHTYMEEDLVGTRKSLMLTIPPSHVGA